MTNILRQLRLLFVRSRLREVRWSFVTLTLGDHLALAEATLRRALGLTPGGAAVAAFERDLAENLGLPHAITFGGGRVAFRALLEALDVGPGDEVIVPGFTCVVVPFAVQHVGATPVYVDIGDDYLLDLRGVEQAITERTKLIVAQHTFGYPDHVDEILALAKPRGIRIVEDSAHALGRWPDGTAPGAKTDAAFFSFENTKPISCFWGGAAATNNAAVAERLREVRDRVPRIGTAQDVRTGLHVLLAGALYHPNVVGIGRLVFAVLSRVGVIRQSIPDAQAQGEEPAQPITRIADTQAVLLARQLRRLPAIAERRRQAADRYAAHLGLPKPGLPLLRYPVQVEERQRAVRGFGDRQVELGQWFQAPLHPATCDFEAAGYRWGSCPKAEEIAAHCANLPTSIDGADLVHVLRVADEALGPLRRPAASAQRT